MAYESTAGQHEPAPKPGRQDVADLVMADIQARVEAGLQKYGTKLQTHNGRDALMDAYQEAIDLVMYLRQAMAERDDGYKGETPLREKLTQEYVDAWVGRFRKDAERALEGRVPVRMWRAIARTGWCVFKNGSLEPNNERPGEYAWVEYDTPRIVEHPAYFYNGWPMEFDQWCKRMIEEDGKPILMINNAGKRARAEIMTALRAMAAEAATS